MPRTHSSNCLNISNRMQYEWNERSVKRPSHRYISTKCCYTIFTYIYVYIFVHVHRSARRFATEMVRTLTGWWVSKLLPATSTYPGEQSTAHFIHCTICICCVSWVDGACSLLCTRILNCVGSAARIHEMPVHTWMHRIWSQIGKMCE